MNIDIRIRGEFAMLLGRHIELKLYFTKMHGCGNDYIYFNCFEQRIIDPETLAVKLSDRHFSVGGDGIVLIGPSGIADAKMRMFNADGSEGKMCGNAIRCVGKYLYDNGIVEKEQITVETLSGVKVLQMFRKDGKVDEVKVDMGKAEWSAPLIPVNTSKPEVVAEPFLIDGTMYSITCVSMGNPHCVVFVDDVENIPIEKIGPLFENDPLFPERINTEFIQVVDKKTLKMRVWERGSGETWACGTGACASAAAAIRNGFCQENEEITVKLRGGDLKIQVSGNTVTMTGKAEKAFEGFVETVS